jgi:hypothetical protein
MNIQFYFEKLHDSEEFQEFREKNPESYLCSGFFVIDKEGNDNKSHLDYFSPKDNRIISFQLESMNKVSMENLGNTVPEEISSDIEFEFDEAENLIIQKMENENINSKVQKILFSLQKIGKDNFLVGTIFISMLGMVKVNINIKEMKITEFEKKSLLDFMKILRKDD